MGEQRQGSRAHLHEIDVIRAVTAFAVVGVHVTSFTLVLAQTPQAQVAQNAVVGALHFTREIFLSITAFVMVYGYAGRRFSTKSFWRKRGIGVLIPFVAWSLFYDWQTKPPLPLGPWLLRALGDVIGGSASFQLYYILLTLEFYLILPWFLWFITKAGKHPWRLLSISFGVQLILLALDYRFVQTAPLNATAFGQWLNGTQNRFLPLYQFNLILGGVAALYLRQVRAFILRYGHWAIAGLALALALLWGNLVYQTNVTHQGMLYGIAVFQPAMGVYALAIAAFLYWLAYRWAVQRLPKPPRWHQFWLVLSNASFGIYLMHAYVLDQVMPHLVPALKGRGPEALDVFLVWVVVAGVTVALCSLFLYVPIASRLIGRPCALPPDTWVGRRLDALSGTTLRQWRVLVGSARDSIQRAGVACAIAYHSVQRSDIALPRADALRTDASEIPQLEADSDHSKLVAHIHAESETR